MKIFILLVLVLILSGCSSMEQKKVSSDVSCVSGNCTNGYGTIIYRKNDSRYTGNFSRGYRHGEGTFAWKNRTMLFGTWENNELNGRCQRREGNESWISGTCKEDNNNIVFSKDSTEQKREVSRQKAHCIYCLGPCA